MTREGIEQKKKAWFVCRGEKTDQPLRFIVKRFDPIVRRISQRHQIGQRDKFRLVDRARMRPGVVIAGAQITGARAFRNELGKSFVQPARNSVGIIAMQNEMRDLVAEQIAAGPESRIPLNEEAALRMDPARPRLEPRGALKLL